MAEQHRATSVQWELVRQSSLLPHRHSDACIMELLSRVEALEPNSRSRQTDQVEHFIDKAFAQIHQLRERCTELESTVSALQNNSKPSPNPGQRSLRATDEELYDIWRAPRSMHGDAVLEALRDIYDLGREHEAQSAAPEPVPSAAPARGSLLEQIAEQVYAAMRFAAVNPADIPDWMPGGNSLMQDHARVTARRILQDVSDWLRRGAGIPPDVCWSQIADVLDALANCR